MDLLFVCNYFFCFKLVGYFYFVLGVVWVVFKKDILMYIKNLRVKRKLDFYIEGWYIFETIGVGFLERDVESNICLSMNMDFLNEVMIYCWWLFCFIVIMVF